MFNDMTIMGLEAMLWQSTSTSALFRIFGPDERTGSPVLGSLDLHYPCEDRAFLAATLAIDCEYQIDITPENLAQQLIHTLQLPQDTLWDIRIYRVGAGFEQDNDPKVFRR